MGWFQREIMRNHWILDVLPWRHAQINILKVSTVGGDHPKTSQEWSIGATSCCQNHGSTSVDGVPTGWCLECPMMVSHLHINPEECCDCTCQKLRHDFDYQVLDVDFSLQNFSGSIQGPRNSSGLLVKMLKFAGPLGFHGISSCVILGFMQHKGNWQASRKQEGLYCARLPRGGHIYRCVTSQYWVKDPPKINGMRYR